MQIVGYYAYTTFLAEAGKVAELEPPPPPRARACDGRRPAVCRKWGLCRQSLTRGTIWEQLD